MAISISDKQITFARLIAQLILHAQSLGYGITFGEAYRSPEEAARLEKTGKGIAASLHTRRLAIDLNLFIANIYQTDSAAYKPLGEWWEAQSTEAMECCWGGRFGRADGNHFSIAHGGRK